MDYRIEELRAQYNFRLTERYIRELETTFELDFSSLRKNKKVQKKHRNLPSKFIQKGKKYEPKPYASIIEEYLPVEEEDYQPIMFLKAHGYTELLNDLKRNKSALSSLKDDKEIFESICHFISENKVAIGDLDTYLLLEKFFTYHCYRIGVQPELFIKAARTIIEGLEQSDNYSTTKSSVIQAFKEIGVKKIRIEDFNPILIPYKDWYRFGHSEIKTYIIVKYIDSFEGDEFSRLITESLWEPDDHGILQFLQSANTSKLWELYITPQLERLLDSLIFTDRQATVLSFVDFFSVKFELEWNKKENKFESFSSSNSEFHLENLLHFCGIGFYISDFEIYFEEDYQHSDAITRLSINTQVLSKLCKRVVDTVPKKTSRHLRNEDSSTVFEIRLSDFLQSEENYTIANDIGMVSYIQDTIRKIKEIIRKTDADG
ncbi:MAG: hypothetical protein ACMVP2_19175 [Imperialibacter sp.]|uniref:hypothetical protein n=1 Tax=Imperialibacter sp. TaxID=2038411 RepID=UPI003A88A1A4